LYIGFFISYSSKDDDFAQRLHADLQHQGVRCWFAPEDLQIGDKFRIRIDESIRVYDKLKDHDPYQKSFERLLRDLKA